MNKQLITEYIEMPQVSLTSKRKQVGILGGNFI